MSEANLNQTNNESIDIIDESNKIGTLPKKIRGNPKWLKGKGGNPNGRPLGSKNKLTLVQEAIRQESEHLLIKHLPDVIKVVIDQAKQGNMVAAKMLLDRAIPPKRAIELTGKDGKEFSVKIVIDKLITHEAVAEALNEDIEDAEYEEVQEDDE
jgi:hypothetical protein